MLLDYLRHVSVQHREMDPHEILHSPPSVLVGVTSEAENALGKLHIRRVLDLATSRIFHAAETILKASESPTAFGAIGTLPGDFIDASATEEPIETLFTQDIELLEGVGSVNGAALKGALPAASIGDLAKWPAYVAAKEILATVFVSSGESEQDSETPQELVPTLGRYPIERSYYSTLVLSHFERAALTLLPVEGGGEADAAADREPTHGLPPVLNVASWNPQAIPVGIGAIVRFRQSWYPQGLAKGMLLHSVPLAAGEQTKIAIIDWARKDAAARSDAIRADESLTAELSRARSVSEVVDAVASEAQSGFSESENTSASGSTARSSGFGSGSGAAGSYKFIAGAGGSGFGFGNQQSNAATQNAGWVSTSSSGTRSLSAELTQKVIDKTQQHASAVRSQRASVIVEAKQEESETVTTRLIENFNHMHALTIEYFEVVQLFRTEVRIAEIAQALFIPLAEVMTWDESTARTHQAAIARHALKPRVRKVLALEPDKSRIIEGWPPQDRPNEEADLLAEAELATGVQIAAQGGEPWDLPADTSLFSISTEALEGSFSSFKVFRNDGSFEEASIEDGQAVLANPIPLSSIERVAASLDHPGGFFTSDSVSGTVTLHLEHNGSRFRYQRRFKISERYVDGLFQIETSGEAKAGWDWLIRHLHENSSHYSQAAWRDMDPFLRATILAGFSYKGQSLLEQVDLNPYGFAGNYIVLRLAEVSDDSIEGREWAEWREKHGLDETYSRADLVPMHTGGVFAEAVLGEFNCAEKLDITRFWNWQDSPRPSTAPDIAPIQTGSRYAAPDLTPASMVAPVVNVQSPPSLPQFSGLAPTLDALTTANMFRDMSGASKLLDLAGQGMELASGLASATGEQAGENFAEASRMATEMAKTAADVYKSAVPGQSGGGYAASDAASRPSTGQLSPSTFGAIGNRLEERDQQTGARDFGQQSSDAEIGETRAGKGIDRSSAAGSVSEEDLYRRTLGIGTSPQGESIEQASSLGDFWNWLSGNEETAAERAADLEEIRNLLEALTTRPDGTEDPKAEDLLSFMQHTEQMLTGWQSKYHEVAPFGLGFGIVAKRVFDAYNNNLKVGDVVNTGSAIDDYITAIEKLEILRAFAMLRLVLDHALDLVVSRWLPGRASPFLGYIKKKAQHNRWEAVQEALEDVDGMTDADAVRERLREIKDEINGIEEKKLGPPESDG